jgi:effector-binding domain-containing protein
MDPALIHRGPYDQLGRIYARILQQSNERKLALAAQRAKFTSKARACPKNSLTEIQLPFED